MNGRLDGLRLAFLPGVVYHPLVLAFELVSLVTLVCVVIAAARRLLFPPEYLGSSYASPRSAEALVILAFIAALMLAFFFLHAADIALGREPAAARFPDFWQRFSGTLPLGPGRRWRSVPGGCMPWCC